VTGQDEKQLIYTSIERKSGRMDIFHVPVWFLALINRWKWTPMNFASLIPEDNNGKKNSYQFFSFVFFAKLQIAIFKSLYEM
jgi:hypothetical protein